MKTEDNICVVVLCLLFYVLCQASQLQNDTLLLSLSRVIIVMLCLFIRRKPRNDKEEREEKMSIIVNGKTLTIMNDNEAWPVPVKKL